MENYQDDGSTKKRTRHACDKCRTRKIKCEFVNSKGESIEVTDKDIQNGNIQCKYCLKVNLNCTFEKSHKKRSVGKKTLLAAAKGIVKPKTSAKSKASLSMSKSPSTTSITSTILTPSPSLQAVESSKTPSATTTDSDSDDLLNDKLEKSASTPKQFEKQETVAMDSRTQTHPYHLKPRSNLSSVATIAQSGYVSTLTSGLTNSQPPFTNGLLDYYPSAPQMVKPVNDEYSRSTRNRLPSSSSPSNSDLNRLSHDFVPPFQSMQSQQLRSSPRRSQRFDNNMTNIHSNMNMGAESDSSTHVNANPAISQPQHHQEANSSNPTSESQSSLEQHQVSISQLQDKIKGLFESNNNSSSPSLNEFDLGNGASRTLSSSWLGYNPTDFSTQAMNDTSNSVTSTPRSVWELNDSSEEKLLKPTREEVNEFHASFFNESQFISEIVFQKKYLACLEANDPFALCLAYMIWAYACFTSEKYFQRSEAYYFEAKRRSVNLIYNDKYNSASGRDPTTNIVGLVQYFVICGDYDLKHGRTAASSLCAATAIRFSQMLGYDRIDDNSHFRRDNFLVDHREMKKDSENTSQTNLNSMNGTNDGTNSLSNNNHENFNDMSADYDDDALLNFAYNLFTSDNNFHLGLFDNSNDKQKRNNMDNLNFFGVPVPEEEVYDEYLLTEEKRRTFWKVFCIDKYYTIGTGLPSGISNKTSIKCRLPYSANLDYFHNSTFKAPEAKDQPPFLHEALERIKRGEILYHLSPSGAHAIFLYFCEKIIIWCKEIHSPDASSDEKEHISMSKLTRLISEYEKYFRDLQKLKNLFKPYSNESSVNYTTMTFKIVHITMLHAIIAIFTKMLKENDGDLPDDSMYEIYSSFRLQCCNLTSETIVELTTDVRNSKKLLVSDSFYFFTTHQVIKSSIQLIVNSNDSSKSSTQNRKLSVLEKQSFNNLLNNLFKVIEIFESLRNRSNIMTSLVLYYTKRLEKFYNKSYDTGFFNDLLGF